MATLSFKGVIPLIIRQEELTAYTTIVKPVALDVVGVLVTFAVVAAQTEELVRIDGTHREDDGKVKLVEVALTKDDAVFVAPVAGDVEFSLFVAAFIL